MPAVFIAQKTLDQWTDAGKVRLEEFELHLLKERRSVSLRPAVRFLRMIDGTEDTPRLLGKVKSADQLRDLGAEHYMDSVLLGDIAYEVIEGYLGDLQPPVATEASTVPPSFPKQVAENAAESQAPTWATLSPRDAPPAPTTRLDTAVAPSAAAADAEKEPNVEDGVDDIEARELSELFLQTVR